MSMCCIITRVAFGHGAMSSAAKWNGRHGLAGSSARSARMPLGRWPSACDGMSMQHFEFPVPAAEPTEGALRRDVRAFLAETLAGRTPRERAQSWNGFDAEFSRELGRRGWIGMSWPKRYGGHERSALER